MARNTLKAVAPAGPAAPATDITLETLEQAIQDAHYALLSPKSIIDLLSAHGLNEHTGEVHWALQDLVDIADAKLGYVEDLVAQLRRQERRA